MLQGMLFLVMPLKIIRSRKHLATIRMITCERALAMYCIDMSSKVFGESESLSMGTAFNVALEGSFVRL